MDRVFECIVLVVITVVIVLVVCFGLSLLGIVVTVYVGACGLAAWWGGKHERT